MQQHNQNYSQEEIDKFNQIAPNWWDLNGPMKPLHKINPVRVKFIQDSLNLNNLNTLKVLDIGCGGGILTEELAKLGGDVTGIDMSPEAINVAKLHAELELNNNSNNYKINYENTSIEDFYENNKNTKYDVITCLELLEHVPDPEKFIEYILKLLKPDGKLFISTLNRNLKSYLLGIVAAEYLLGWVPKGTHEHSKFIKPSELASILRKHNKNISSLKGISFNIFSSDFYLSDDTDVNYIVAI